MVIKVVHDSPHTHVVPAPELPKSLMLTGASIGRMVIGERIVVTNPDTGTSGVYIIESNVFGQAVLTRSDTWS